MSKKINELTMERDSAEGEITRLQERIAELEADLAVMANHHLNWQGGTCYSQCRCNVCTIARKAVRGGKP